MELTTIQHKIYIIRGQRIMLDFDLAALYGIETRALNQAVKRNYERFPEDFMFQLTKEENDILKSQIVTSSWGGSRKAELQRNPLPQKRRPIGFVHYEET